MPLDIKTDIQIAFNLMKSENNTINKLKLRTLIFSFIMYKYSALEINEYIESKTSPNQEIFTFDEVCYLINEKLKEARERESDELFNYIVNNKKEKTEINKMNKTQLSQAFKENEINIEESELDKMIDYMNKKDVEEEEEEDDENKEKKSKKEGEVGRNEFKKFFIEQK